ncbi:hypothetical protein TBLA_0A08310 [Henningerozyma blattae CBS 6284]|uniref:Uncharacterized protein n=1 Tax=Henningerozyma blattae (strain ATCC 34711 / CBS 6284 / DSM 70876 / NBRC 10599 / NRRL Y-10934 / UCD 77-7) TaxID=1071380 RepID=I2GWW8_HENB6|nr:hypothetical protein TBLA_0A08310 [Tetrapisispora blattae CBS 6284]CCH58620.1 hypothetical protein TBLA_0A08310 [Tetrapisispora blattae CBS 6284]
MVRYLLSHRVRHVKSIAIHNISLIKKGISNPIKSNEINTNLFMTVPCFFIVETLDGDCIYISEVQSYSSRCLQFNELPNFDCSLSGINLKIVCKLPSEILTITSKKDTWCILKEIVIDLNRLRPITDKDAIQSVNMPSFELCDGIYTLANVKLLNLHNSTKRGHIRSKSSMKIKEVSSFNSLLKLNKALDYNKQINEEKQEFANRSESLIGNVDKKEMWNIQELKMYIKQIKESIEKKNSIREHLEEVLGANLNSRVISTSSMENEVDYDYGNKSSKLIHINNRLRIFNLLRFEQLINIFYYSKLFESNTKLITIRDFTVSGENLYDRIHFHLLDTKKILKLLNHSNEDKNYINIHLGYYLLFVNLLTTTIWNIPMPYQMKYVGNRSLINRNYPLYFPEMINESNVDSFVKGMSFFNKNIIQVRQYLKYR